eukprot:SAG22_NODE_262_length_13373_cov_11.716965_9_plen_444_part_00
MLLLLLAGSAAAAAAADGSAGAAAPAPIWTGGQKLARVAVMSNGSYSVSLGGSTLMVGEAAQTVAGTPLALLSHSAVAGAHDKLGAFTGVAMTVGRAGEQAARAATGVEDPEGGCGELEHDRDYAGNDIRFVDNVTDPAVCCALCAAEKTCAGFSLMGAADTGKLWARRCYLKCAMTKFHKFKTHISAKVPGRTPAPAPPSPGPHPGPAPPPPPGKPLPPGVPLSLVLTVKYFEATDLFLFEQAWPDGLELQYTGRAGIAAAFPNFELSAAKLPALSAITWSGEMSGGEVCVAASAPGGDDAGGQVCATIGGSKAASGFPEDRDAPLVLHDAAAAAAAPETAPVVVLSPFDMFGHQRSAAGAGSGGGATLGWGPDLGLAPAAMALPSGYNSTCALFGGSGGVNHVMHQWGAAMQKGHGTARVAADPLTTRVGYWTDNVAFYDW